MIAANYQFVVKARHISGVSNRIPDWLWRWHETAARREFRKHAEEKSLRHIRVSNALLQFDNRW